MGLRSLRLHFGRWGDVNRCAEYIGDFVKDIFLLGHIQFWPNSVQRETGAFYLSNIMSSKKKIFFCGGGTYIFNDDSIITLGVRFDRRAVDLGSSPIQYIPYSLRLAKLHKKHEGRKYTQEDLV